MLELRAIQPTDEAALGQFFRLLLENGDERLFHPHPLTQSEAERISILEGSDVYAVAMIDKEIAAYGMLRGWDEGFDIPSLGIAVSPVHRAKGIGTVLMHYLHITARLMNAEQIRLTVEQGNPAINLYRKLGYCFHDTAQSPLVGILTLSNKNET